MYLVRVVEVIRRLSGNKSFLIVAIQAAHVVNANLVRFYGMMLSAGELFVNDRWMFSRETFKEKLYRSILKEIRSIKPELKNFNIGRTTRYTDRWTEPYLHWKFTPRKRKFNSERTKQRKR